jgi:sugar lactone lactonase YvrE
LLPCLGSLLPIAAAAEVEVLRGPPAPDPGSEVEPGELNTPFAVEFDSMGRMLIVEYDGGRLLRINQDGSLETLAGDGTLGYRDGDPAQARFNKLHNLAIDAEDRVFLSDHLNHAVRLYDPAGPQVRSFAGNGKAGDAGDGQSRAAARFERPICVTLSPDHQRLLIADINNRRIRQIDLASGTLTTLVGNGKRGRPADGTPALQAPLVDPRAAAEAENGDLYLLERGGHALRRVRDGKIETVAGDGQAGHLDGPALQARFNGPKHLDIAPDSRLVIADDVNHQVRLFDPASGRVSTLDLGPYRLRRPHGVKVHDGWLYIADSFHHRILRTPLP